MKQWFLISFCILISFLSFGQDYLITNFNTEEGIKQSEIYSITADSTGYLFLGGDKGISYFNGTHFDLYRNYELKPSEKIAKVFEYHNDKKLTLTNIGNLFVFDGTDFSKYLPHKDLVDKKIVSLLSLKENSLLFGTQNNGVYILKKDSIVHFQTNSGLYSNNIKKIYKGKNEQIFIVSEKGVNIYHENQIKPLLVNDLLNHTLVIEDSKGKYWSFVDNKGIFVYEKGGNNQLVQKNMGNYWLKIFNGNYNYKINSNNSIIDLSNIAFRQTNEDIDGVLWFSCNYGLFRIIENMYGELYIWQEINSTEVNVLLCDSSANTWTFAKGQGLFRIQKNQFFNFTVSNGFPSYHARVLCKNSQNRIFLEAKSYGLFSISDYKHEVFEFPDSLKKKRISAMTETTPDNYVFACENRLMDFNKGIFTEKTQFEAPINTFLLEKYEKLIVALKNKGIKTVVNNLVSIDYHFNKNINVTSMIKTSNNKILLGADEGLFYIENDTIKSIGEHITQKIQSITEVSDSLIYAATEDKIFLIQNQMIVDSILTNQFFNNSKIKVLGTYNDILTIGTSHGLFLFKNGSFKSLSTKNGLLSNEISGDKIISKNGKLYIATNAGLSIFLIDNYLKRKSILKSYFSKIETDFDTVYVNRLSGQKKEFSFSEHTNFIKFDIEVANTSNKPYFHQYYLVFNGDTSDLRKVNANNVLLSNLRVGDYRIVLLTYQYNSSFAHTSSVNFSIKRPFYKQSAVLVSFAFMFFLFTGIIVKRKKMTKLSSDEKYKTSSLSKAKSREIKSLILNFMEKDQLYKDSDLTLQILAAKLNVSKEHVSQVINSNFDTNYNTFINQYRIKEACNLLRNKSKDELNILQVAYESGFNSKTSFNTAFKKIIGCTPTEYRKNNTTFS